jgi:hypothetical protein
MHLTRWVAAIALSICLSGCVLFMGDPVYFSHINILFPGKTKEQAAALILDVGVRKGYKKGGTWTVDGLIFSEYRERHGCSQLDECSATFIKQKRVWREAKEIRTEDSIEFWFDVLTADGSHSGSPSVKIKQTDDGSTAAISFMSFLRPFSLEQKAEYFALKQVLVDRFGTLVTTSDEP